MANQYKPLWIDPFENILYSGWQNTQSAPSLVFKQGDKIDIELFLVKRGISSSSQEEVEFPAGSTIRFAVGKLDTPPTAGTMVISYDGEQTGNIPHNSTAATIQTALNAVSTIASAGGVEVSVVSSTIFRIAFNEVGARPAPLLDTTGLSPTSSGKVITARAGTSTLPAIYLFKVNQSVAVFQNNWVDSQQPTITATTLVANQTKRVTILPLPLSGTWTLSTTPSIARLVEDAGDEDDVPAYWTQTVSSRLGAFASSFLGEDGRPIWNMSVIQIGPTSWDFTVRNDYDVPVGYTMPFTVDGNFTKFPSKVSTVNFDTVEVEYLLDGADSVTASLEIEVESPSGDKWTVLQTSCTIVNDLIDQATYSPLVLETPLQDAPSDGSLYARQDGAWVAFTEEDNQGITQSTGDARYAQQSNNLSDLDDLAQARTNLGVYSTSQVDTALTGKANTSHTHAISDVTGLQTALNDKAGVYHNHNVFTLDGQYFQGAVDGDVVRIYNPSLYGGTGNNVLISRPVTWWEQPRNGQPMPNVVLQGTFQKDDGFGGFIEGSVVITVSFDKYLNRLNTGQVTLTAGMGSGLAIIWVNGNDPGYYNYGSEYYGDTLNLEVPANDSIQYQAQYADADSGISVSLGVTGGDPSGVTWGGLTNISGQTYQFATSSPTSMDEPVMKRGLIQTFIQELNRFRAWSFTPSTSYPDYNLVWRSGTNKFELDNSLPGYILSVANSLENYALKSGANFTGPISVSATSGAPIAQFDQYGAAGCVLIRSLSGSSSGHCLRIENRGIGSSLLVEDSNTPDTSAFIVNNNGVVGIQRSTSWTPAAGVFLDVGGKGVFTPTATYAGINIGSNATSPTSTSSGDLWIGSNNIFFRDASNATRIVANINSQNTFQSPQIISATTTSTLLRIVQTGTGRAIVVEDDGQNPDLSSFVVDASGNVGIGVHPTNWTATEKFEVQGGIKFSDNSVQTTAYIPSNVAITGGTIDNVVIDGGTY